MESFVELFQLALGNIWLYGGSFLLVLTILVFVHEWGHFIVARMCGVRVDVFSIGFGKELWGYTAKNGTRWKFSILPLGGYVKMFGDADPASAGQDDSVEYNEGDRKVAFFSQPVWKRSAIVFAGPAINFIFAIMILASLFAFKGKVETLPVVSAIQVGKAADISGFKVHDRVIEIDGRETTTFDDIRRSVAIALDSEMSFKVMRDEEVIDLIVTPERYTFEDKFGFEQSIGRIGILGPSNGILISGITSIDGTPVNAENLDAARKKLLSRVDRSFEIGLKGVTEDGESMRVFPSSERNGHMSDDAHKLYNALVLTNEVKPQQFIQYSPFMAVKVATEDTASIVVDSLGALAQIFTGHRSPKELGGVIRIGAVAGDMADRGWLALVMFAALISINLGLINLFPIPMLDGGHLAMYAIEAVKGSPVSERIQEHAFRAGLIFLVGLMAFANINDIVQILF